MKYTLIILTFILIFSGKNENSKTDLTINCIEKTNEENEDPEAILIKTCNFNNHLFKSIGIADDKGRYSYVFELYQITQNDTLAINNSDFFNERANELEKLINVKLKTEYELNSKISEISDCMKWIKFRYYNLNELGISFTEKNQMEFSINYGIGNACFNVNSSYVVIDVSEIEQYLK